ncbi:MAG: flagellar basal-body MS-ring/collar protein FliF [Candidatus Acidiferrales bacterium]
MDKFFKQVMAFLQALSLRQKILLGGSAVVVAAVLGGFVLFTQKADYKPLFSGLAPADSQEVAERLAIKNIPYEISTDGSTISVPEDQLDKTRLVFATEGMPQTGRMGFEIFDKPNWAGSDFSEQVNYQRALEGELERTIQTLGNVESVRVHLVLPHDSLFSDRERAAKASVVLKVRGGGLSDDEVNAVTHLVAGAVDNLSPENVTLIGADGRTPLVARGHDAISGQSAPVEYEAAMAEKLVSTLAPIVGADHVKASVTADYDMSSGDTTQEIYDPTNPVLASSQVQEESFGGAPPAGIPGTPSNVPAAPANAAAKPAAGAKPAANAATPAAGQAGKEPPTSAQSNPLNPIVSINSESDVQRSETRQYDVSKTLRHTVDPSGRIQKIAAAVLVDDAVEEKKDAKGNVAVARRKRTPEEMQQIVDLAKASIGFDASRGDVLSVQNVSFETSPSEQAPPPSRIDRVRVMAEKWMWAIRDAVLLLLFLLAYVLFLRPVKDQLVKAFDRFAPSALPRGAVQHAAAGASAGAGAAMAASLAGQADGFEMDADFEKELGEAGSEVQRVVRMKRVLADKVKNDPTAASQLVRHWIREGSKS